MTKDIILELNDQKLGSNKVSGNSNKECSTSDVDKIDGIPGPHGRETYAVNFGDDLVMKRPLPGFSIDAKIKWLEKQHKTKEIIDDIKSVENPTYHIPKMIYIKDDEFQLLEERAHGERLTPELYRSLSKRQRIEIINSVANFLVDMNESKPVYDEELHKLTSEIKMNQLDKIIDKKMPKWFDKYDIKYMENLVQEIDNFEYTTIRAWSHSDLNAGNVLYDAKNSKLYFIDFAEASYNFIYRDIFSPLNVDLGICKYVYDLYNNMHDKSLYRMPGLRSAQLQKIMQYRIMTVLLKRFIKAGGDLRPNTKTEKGKQNNVEKSKYMSLLIQQLQFTERQLSK